MYDSTYQAYNEALKSVADATGSVYIDLPAHWPMDLEERRAIVVDGQHPTDEGHVLIAEIIYRELVKHQ